MASDGYYDAWELDAEGVDPDQVEKGGGFVDKEGMYHLEIVDVVDELQETNKNGEPRTPALRFDMMVLQSVQGQSPEGAMHFHRIYFSGKDGARDQAFKFGLRLRLLSKIDGQIRDAQDPSAKITPGTFMRAKGLQIVAKIKFEEGKGEYKGRYAIPFNEVWSIDDPRVESVPKNPEHLRLAGVGAAGGQPATSAPSRAPSAVDDLSDL